ncbi:hypothetical protein [Paenibacillus flagellatus]|uniref:Uncharacterized protein n=1 Tax=Paenibacillus flagellatus TaxID=2211139 RepID=A0A2V5K2W6_9BACL|nr:hypothetical protein [Paenibacillus flagellatus]PYI52134.1 hypothetical protein DLM86_21900 [Paenibacillus flagellatus]
MNDFRRRNELMLDMLESLARSQRAIAKMIESVADVSDDSPNFAKQLAGNLQTIGRYQRAVLERLTGIRLTRVGRSDGAKPWVNRTVKVMAGGTSDETKQDRGDGENLA